MQALASKNKRAFKALKTLAAPAPVAPKTRRYVKKAIKRALDKDEEKKWFGSGRTLTDVYGGAAGYTQQNLLSGLTQGLADNARDGDKIRLTSIRVRLLIRGPIGGTTSAQQVRIMIFQYKAGPAVPALANLLLNDIPTGGPSTYSHRDVDYYTQMVMLYDKVFTVVRQDATGANTPPNWERFIIINVPLKYAQKQIHFIAGSAVNIANPIYLAAIGHYGTTAGGTNAQYAFEHRIRFKDP